MSILNDSWLETLNEECVGKRFLLRKLTSETFSEYFVIELSPTKKFVKLQAENGYKFWEELNKMRIVEKLNNTLSDPTDSTNLLIPDLENVVRTNFLLSENSNR